MAAANPAFKGVKALIVHDPVGADARPDEQDTVRQVMAIRAALNMLGFQTRTLAAPHDRAALEGALRAAKSGLVFNLVESHPGLVRVPRTLERLGIPFTGCSSEAVLTTTDKVGAKRRMVDARIPTPPWMPVAQLPDALHFDRPYIVKPVNEDASIGIGPVSVVADTNDLRRVYDVYGLGKVQEWFAERFIEGREFNLSILGGPDGPRVLPAAEIVFEGYPAGRPPIVDYVAKWDEASPEYRGTRRVFRDRALDGELVERLESIALACWSLFRLSGYARVDFRVDAKGNPWVLEVNANPCLSPDAGFVAAAGQAGYPYAEMVACIVTAAMAERSDERPADAH